MTTPGTEGQNPYHHPGYRHQPPAAQPGYPHQTPPGGRGDPYQPPQFGPPPRRKRGRAAWLIGGGLAVLLVGLAVAGGVVLFLANRGGEANAGAQGSAPPVSPSVDRNYEPVKSLCGRHDWSAARKLAPERFQKGTPEKPDEQRGAASVACMTIGFATADDTGRVVVNATVDYYRDASAARKAYQKGERKCRDRDGEKVPGVGQAACVRDKDITTDSGGQVLQSWLQVWDGNIMLHLEYYGGGTYNDSHRKLHRAAADDAKALLAALRTTG